MNIKHTKYVLAIGKCSKGFLYADSVGTRQELPTTEYTDSFGNLLRLQSIISYDTQKEFVSALLKLRRALKETNFTKDSSFVPRSKQFT